METSEEKTADAKTTTHEVSNSQTKQEQPNKHGKVTFEDVKTALSRVYLWVKKPYRLIIAAIIVILSANNILPLLNWLKPIKLTARPVEISYMLEDLCPVEREGRIEYKKGVSCFAKVYLKALNKNCHVSRVVVFIVMKPNNEPREVTLHRSSPPAPSSDTFSIQHLRLLEKDKDYLCYINFSLEGEQKDSYAEMAFERIELRLYDDDGRYKKLNLYHSDFSEI